MAKRHKSRRHQDPAPPEMVVSAADFEAIGGGWYRLPDGRKVQGRATAEAAMAAFPG